MLDRTTRFLVLFSALTVLIALIGGVLPIHGEEEVYDRTLRLHVLANSDSDEDQALKLQVRDRVLDEIEKIVLPCESKTEAISAIQEAIPFLTEVASDCVRQQGYAYEVRLETGIERYPTRRYEAMALPAGSYWSLRVLIGEADGQNWWCVLYPPLCLNTARAEEQLVEAGFTFEQVQILTEQEDVKYVLRFRVLEVLRQFWEELRGK